MTQQPSRARTPRSPRFSRTRWCPKSVAEFIASAGTSAAFALLTAVLTAGLLMRSSAQLSMTWDEGNAILRAERIAAWFAEFVDECTDCGLLQNRALEARAIRDGWWFVNRREGHPSLYGIVIAAGTRLARLLTDTQITPLHAARCGPIACFAVALSVVQFSLWRSHGCRLALASTCAILVQPRLFAHAQIASFDGPLTSCCMMCWAIYRCRIPSHFPQESLQDEAEPAGQKQRPRSFPAPHRLNRRPSLRLREHTINVVWIVSLGLMLSSKFTGWFMMIPYLGLALTRLRRTRQGRMLRVLARGAPETRIRSHDVSLTHVAGALAVFFALNPPLWIAPASGLADFLWYNALGRRDRGYNVPTFFRGALYDLDHPLPWYNGIYWVVATLPTLTTPLALWGLIHLRRFGEDGRQCVLLAANAFLLPAARALPQAPPHDAERLILPCFPFVGILAAHGWCVLLPAGPQQWRGIRLAIATSAAILWGISAGSALQQTAPHWLSYYSLWVGGPATATARGMEPTYYWDAFDQQLQQWLQHHTSGDSIYASHFPDDNLSYLRRWDPFWHQVRNRHPRACQYYLFQNRPSMFSDLEWCLLQRHTPWHRHELRSSSFDLPARLTSMHRAPVPLVFVYRHEQYLECLRCLEIQEGGP